LGQLTGFHARVIASRFGRVVVADPRAVFGMKLIQVVVSMWAKRQGIADEGTHGAIFKGE
jgi:hypothetical protein